MKTHRTAGLLLLVAATLPLTAKAGTLSYRPISSTESDLRAGLLPGRKYTAAVAAGKEDVSEVNGVRLTPLPATGNSSAAGNASVGVETGTLVALTREETVTSVDGRMAEIFSAGIGSKSDDGEASELFVALEPKSLVSGRTYEMRVYLTAFSARERNVRLTFVGDGKAAVSTGFFNEDDARTSQGKFRTASQAYYINYRYRWDGVNTPGFTVTQKSARSPFVLYALTNHEVPSDEAASETTASRSRVRKPGTTVPPIIIIPDNPPPPQPPPGTYPPPPGVVRPGYPGFPPRPPPTPPPPPGTNPPPGSNFPPPTKPGKPGKPKPGFPTPPTPPPQPGGGTPPQPTPPPPPKPTPPPAPKPTPPIIKPKPPGPPIVKPTPPPVIQPRPQPPRPTPPPLVRKPTPPPIVRPTPPQPLGQPGPGGPPPGGPRGKGRPTPTPPPRP